MESNKLLAELLYPNIKEMPQEIEKVYPPRELPQGAIVTRFAPSPTGFIHIGGVYASLVAQRLARQSKGIFYLRIEDTDKKREIEGGVSEIIKGLRGFGISFDEGCIDETHEVGKYGPYMQSKRKHIYQAFAKYLVEEGFAYPCFCTEEELAQMREMQEKMKIRPGYYGQFAKDRNLSLEDIKANLETGKPFVLRLKSPGNYEKRILFKDLIRGNIEMPENDQDVVLMKSDGIPLYHFAHAIDDRLMRTTHVIRGDEWLSSLPLHIQIFQIFGWEAPQYAHMSPIMIKEGDAKRKISKRKDPEAAVKYYHEQGYPAVAVTEYLLNIANSPFENWRRSNPTEPNENFPIELDRMSVSGALFDINKLRDISRDLIAAMTAEQVYDFALAWAEEYDTQIAELLRKNADYAKTIFDIERNKEKPRKDIEKWLDVRETITYFYDELFDDEKDKPYEMPDNISKEDIKNILVGYQSIYESEDEKPQWFERIRSLSEELGFAKEMKSYKAAPESFKGHVGDVSTIIRVALTKRRNTPDLYEIMRTIGKEKVIQRIEECVKGIH